ncbi:undecaprenyl-phosphate glucose phosphotransferase [Actimicrobium antarcticum]|uniref:Exopolysaccharide biosynthesis glycosyltransferase VpsL n=1 Tax=Actimicrobium antarcticum TaxID=1051899 RepID=A0ABP7T4I1_9BURK
MTINNTPLVSFFKRLLDPFIILSLLYGLTWMHGEVFTGYYLVLAIIAFFVSSYVYEQIDLYRTWRSGRLLAYARGILIGWIIIVAMLMFIGHVTGLSYRFSDQVILIWFTVTPVGLLVSHLALRRIASNLRNDGEVRSVVIVGANAPGIKLAKRIVEFPDLFMEVHGFFDDRSTQRQEGAEDIQLLGKMVDIADYVRLHGIQMIFISQPMSAQPRIRKLIDELKDTTASIYFLPDIYVFDLMQARFDNVGGVPVVAICETPFTGFNSVVKRTSDVVLATLIQILLTPVMIGIAIAIKLTSPGPIIFKQLRYGLNGEEIIVYKFRSMKVHSPGDTVVQAQKNDSRLTSIGGFLRRSSLDELPQFINVLQGRMSIVGPRPHAVAHNELYRKQIKGYMLRHKVKPGITGWAQVNGMRGETDTLDKMEARIELDLDYLRSWSLALDFWIIFRTIKVVLKRDNAY